MSDPFKDALRNERPHSDTPETDSLDWSCAVVDTLEQRRTQMARNKEKMESIERQRNEARAEVARLQMELDASCNAEELRQVREENARLREALQANLFHHALACVWRHQDGTFDDKARVTEDSCQCPPKTKAFRKLLGTNSENKGFDP